MHLKHPKGDCGKHSVKDLLHRDSFQKDLRCAGKELRKLRSVWCERRCGTAVVGGLKAKALKKPSVFAGVTFGEWLLLFLTHDTSEDQ